MPVLHLSLCSHKGSNFVGKWQLTNKPIGATVNLQVWLFTGWEEAWCLSDWPRPRSASIIVVVGQLLWRLSLIFHNSFVLQTSFCFHFYVNICTGHVVILIFLSQAFLIYELFLFTSLILDMTTIRPRLAIILAFQMTFVLLTLTSVISDLIRLIFV